MRVVRCSLFLTADDQVQPALFSTTTSQPTQYFSYLQLSLGCGEDSTHESQQGRLQATWASLDTLELEADSAGCGVGRNGASTKHLETGHRSSTRTNRIQANGSSALTPQHPICKMLPRGTQCMVWLPLDAETYVRRRQQCKLTVLLRGVCLRMHSSEVRLHPNRTDPMVVHIGETRYRFAVWNFASACSQYRSW